MRKAIAAQMSKSWITSPKCDFEMQILAGPMIDFVKKARDYYECKISYLNVDTKACAIALKEFPYVNSSYDSERAMHIFHDAVNIGIAITVGDGLMVGNVRDADKPALGELQVQLDDLIAKVKSGTPLLDDITGSTFTINNMGGYRRLMHHNAIINQPELAILSMYAIADRPVVIDGKIAVRKCMTLMLSADHRVIDGKMACEFLNRICEILEDPEQYIGLA